MENKLKVSGSKSVNFLWCIKVLKTFTCLYNENYVFLEKYEGRVKGEEKAEIQNQENFKAEESWRNFHYLYNQIV